MIFNKRKNDYPKTSTKIFVLGSGRSGTHLLGYVLDSHPEISTTVEEKKLFNMVTQSALYPDKKNKLIPKIIKKYKKYHKKAFPLHYADKSHPNIWNAEELAEAFPDSKYIGIQRNPYQVVNSMLRHKGVRKWQEIWSEFPIPNPFLGVSQANLEYYKYMKPEEKATLRWIAHAQKLNELKYKLGDRLLIVDYENLVSDSSDAQKRIQNFLKLDLSFPNYEMKEESLQKWNHQLSTEQVENIRKVLDRYYSCYKVNEL